MVKYWKHLQNENTPFNPVSPYAAAKLYAYYMVKCYREGYNLFAVNGIFLIMKVREEVKIS